MRVALIQQSPVFLNLPATMERAEELVMASSREGADLVVFPETWLPGYPPRPARPSGTTLPRGRCSDICVPIVRPAGVRKSPDWCRSPNAPAAMS